MRATRVWTLSVLGLLAVTFCATSATAQFKKPFAKKEAAKIKWLDDPIAAVELARKLDRPLLVYATADYCTHCRRMERETWSNTKIVDKVDANFVAFKLDAEKHQELMAHLKIASLPTTLVFCQDGKMLADLEGFRSSDDLFKVLAKKDRPVAQVTPKK